MATHIGAGYGSELHLMRYMARYRQELDKAILDKTGGDSITWHDFKHGNNYDCSNPQEVHLPDNELTGINFLTETDYSKVVDAWKQFWPQGGTSMNWDAAGYTTVNNRNQYILVEAKAHTEEIKSDCGADPGKSMKHIDKAFTYTKDWLGITSTNDWKKTYYQMANRLAMIHFLAYHDIPAKLVNIYFCGDKNPSPYNGATCPSDANGWKNALNDQYEYLGLTEAMRDKAGMVDLYIDVEKPIE